MVKNLFLMPIPYFQGFLEIRNIRNKRNKSFYDFVPNAELEFSRVCRS